jgi:phosphoglycolate phosphatase
MIRTIIFDLDGTLVDSKKDIAHSVNRTLIRFNLPEKKLEEIYTMIGEGIYKLILQALTGHEEKVESGVEVFRAYYRKNLLDTTVCYPGIYEVLDQIEDRFLAVITNKPKEFTIPILKGLELLDRFDLIISGDEMWPKKPSPDSIYEVMKRSASSGPETLNIGDHYTDILAGKNADIVTCWASYGFGQRRNLVPDLTISKPMDLIEYVKSKHPDQ